MATNSLSLAATYESPLMILKKKKLYIYKTNPKKLIIVFFGIYFLFFNIIFLKNIFSKKEEDNFKEYIQQKMNSYDWIFEFIIFGN